MSVKLRQKSDHHSSVTMTGQMSLVRKAESSPYTVCMGQIEVKTGDVEGNTARAIGVVEAMGDKVDFILLPELVVSGYACGSLFETEDFISACKDATDQIIEATSGKSATVIFGAPDWADGSMYEPNGTLRLANSAFVVENGEVLGIYDKMLLANDYQHEDRKYFIPGTKPLVLRRGDLTYGVLICEDVWGADHGRDLVEEMKVHYPSLGAVFVPNFSYFTYEKQQLRSDLLGDISMMHGIDVYYTNAVGIGDAVKNIICYDGRSMAFNREGRMIEKLPAFETCTGRITASSSVNTASRTDILGNPWAAKNRRLWGAMLYVQKELYAQVGVGKAQVHVSGGLDSAIVAVLAAKAMGPDNCVFITNPSRANGSLTQANARHTADKLGVSLHVMPVEDVVSKVAAAIYDDEDDECIPADPAVYQDHLTPLALGTAQAVGRTVIGLTVANQLGAAVSATGNHTENCLGWFTFHDIGSSGLYQPIGDLTKTELFSLAAWINNHYGEELIPRNIYDGSTKPMAELADAKDDPFDYFLYSAICAEMIRHRATAASLVERFESQALDIEPWGEDWLKVYDYTPKVFRAACIDAERRIKRSVFKCAQAAPTLKLSPRSRGFSSRETILNHFKGIS